MSSTMLMIWACLAGPVLPAPSDAPTGPSPAQPTGEGSLGSMAVRLGRRFGVTQDQEDAASTDGVLAEIGAALERLGEDRSMDRIRLLLGSANLRLALDAEPPASRFLLGLSGESDLQAWRETATAARDEIGQARRVWEGLADPTTEQQELEYDRLGETMEILESFAQVFAALSEPDEGNPEALTEAVIGLSAFLEAEDRHVARAATLWQAAALRRIGRPERAGELLELPLSPPGPAPLALFVRLERLRCLAEMGSLEASMVLALRMEEACDEWYPKNEQKREEARRACTWVRLQLYERYLRRVKERQSESEIEAWTRLCDQIRRMLRQDEQTVVVARLGKTMPVLVEYEDALVPPAPEPAEPATQPATQATPESSDDDAAPASQPVETPDRTDQTATEAPPQTLPEEEGGTPSQHSDDALQEPR